MRYFLIVFATSTWAFAQSQFPVLPTFPAPPANPLKTVSKADPACSEIVQRLVTYNDDVRANDQAVLGFVGQVAGVADTWYTSLAPLENQNITVPVDAFVGLKNYSERIGEVTSWGYDNSAYFAEELDKIIVALRGCGL